PFFSAVETLFVPREKFAFWIVRKRSDDFHFVAAAREFRCKEFQTRLSTADFGWKVLRKDQESHREMVKKSPRMATKPSKPGPTVQARGRERGCSKAARQELQKQTCGTLLEIFESPANGSFEVQRHPKYHDVHFACRDGAIF